MTKTGFVPLFPARQEAIFYLTVIFTSHQKDTIRAWNPDIEHRQQRLLFDGCFQKLATMALSRPSVPISGTQRSSSLIDGYFHQTTNNDTGQDLFRHFKHSRRGILYLMAIFRDWQ